MTDSDLYAMHALAQPTILYDLPSPSYLPLLALPSELLSSVLTFLSPSELLLNLTPAAQILRDIIRDERSLWKFICKQRFDAQEEEEEEEDDDGGDEYAGRPSTSWFRPDDPHAASPSPTILTLTGSPALSSLSPSPPTRWLRLYRSFCETAPRPLKLRIMHVDDHQRPPTMARPMTDEAAESSETYEIENILRPDGRPFSSTRNRNVHVILAMQHPTTNGATTTKSTANPTNDLDAPMVPSASTDGLSPSSSASPLPPSFLLTDFKLISPSDNSKSPLSSGFLFFTRHLPTPNQIRAWDDWSERQWMAREAAIKEDGDGVTNGAGERIQHAKEAAIGIERGELERPERLSHDTDGERERAEEEYRMDPIPESYPIEFDEDTTFDSFSQHVAPVAAFFRIEANGDVTIESTPQPQTIEQSNTNDTNAENVTDGDMSHSESNVDPSSSSSSASSSVSPPPPLLSSTRVGQVPYSYRHHFPRPIFGRFLTLTFLRASNEQNQIDVTYFGVKGYRRGMKTQQQVDAMNQAAAHSAATADVLIDSASPPVTAAPAPPPFVDPDDGFDFDALPSHSDTAVRLRAYLQSLQRMGAGMAEEVAMMDAHLARVQSVLAAQQRAQQQQQALRIRMLLLQTQQLQLQLQNQHLATRATLAHAQVLQQRTSSFVAQRRALLDAVDMERQAHRNRLEELTEEKQREEILLHDLRQRVQAAKEREDSLREQLRRNHEQRDRIEHERLQREANGHQPEMDQPMRDDSAERSVPPTNQPPNTALASSSSSSYHSDTALSSSLTASRVAPPPPPHAAAASSSSLSSHSLPSHSPSISPPPTIAHTAPAVYSSPSPLTPPVVSSSPSALPVSLSASVHASVASVTSLSERTAALLARIRAQRAVMDQARSAATQLHNANETDATQPTPNQ